MKLPLCFSLAVVVMAGGLSGARAQTATPGPVVAAVSAPKPPASIHYRPPVSGAPAVRGTGGTRGGAGEQAALYVLAPEHEGLTTLAQPALFWFQSAPAKSDFEITLTEPKKAQPLLDLHGGPEQQAGIHSVSLAAHHLTLQPGVSYRWSVALVPDAHSRSRDIVATGTIRHLAAPPELVAKIQKAATPAERATIYASSGYWYDALQYLSLAIAAEPKNAALHHLRASLLEQGKLKEAAAFAAR